VWLKATAEERHYISCLKCPASVRYLYVGGELLARRLSRAGCEAFRLEQLEWWSAADPQMLLLGKDLCAAADAMTFMLKWCARTDSECREILQQAKSGRLALDSAEKVLLSGRCATWEAYAREVYTLILHVPPGASSASRTCTWRWQARGLRSTAPGPLDPSWRRCRQSGPS